MESLKSKIENLKSELIKTENKYDECVAKVKEEIAEKYHSNSFDNQVRRYVSLFFGEYIKYKFEEFQRGTVMSFNDKSCSLIKGKHECSEEKGFVFKLEDILGVYNIGGNIDKLWIYHCERNNYRKSFEEFKTTEPSKILEIYQEWYRNKYSNKYLTVEIISDEEFELENMVLVWINKY